MKASDLRNAVLRQAIQGKLVQQNPNDEPASALLNRIKEEKERLIKNGNIKRDKPLPQITEDEKPFEIPDGWEWVRLGELSLKLGAGSTPTGGKAVYKTEGIKFIRSQNVYNDGLRLNDIAYIDETTNNKMKGSQVLAQDVLLNITGASIGRCCIVDDTFDIGNVNQHVSIIRLVDKALNRYIHFCIISDYIQNLIMDVQVGVSREGLSMIKLSKFLIPIPPLAEQQRIVNRIEEIMPKIDEYEKLEQELSNLETTFPDNLRKSILQYAVQGKLVQQDPNDGPTSALIERIEAEKEKLIKEGKIKREKTLPEITAEEKPFEIPDNWEWVRLSSIIINCDYGTSEKASEIKLDNSIPVLRMNNILPNGQISFENVKYLSRDIPDLPRLLLQNEDLLFNRTNSYELVGKTGLYSEADGNYTFASYLIRLKPLINSRYLNIYMNSNIFRKTQIEPYIIQQNGQANYNGTKLKSTVIPLPPIVEQQRIVDKVEELMFLCDELKAV